VGHYVTRLALAVYSLDVNRILVYERTELFWNIALTTLRIRSLISIPEPSSHSMLKCLRDALWLRTTSEHIASSSLAVVHAISAKYKG
jgi:hypothetical protein